MSVNAKEGERITGSCDVGMYKNTHKNMHSHVFMCFMIYVWPAHLRAWVCASMHACIIPVQNVEREVLSSETEAACQCCPLGTDTRGASGLLNRLPGWVGSHTSTDTEGEEREEQMGVEEQKEGN